MKRKRKPTGKKQLNTLRSQLSGQALDFVEVF